jgi:hypothetical protein
MENIKKDYYPMPIQVKFGQRNSEGEIEDNYGIAFKENIAQFVNKTLNVLTFLCLKETRISLTS